MRASWCAALVVVLGSRSEPRRRLSMRASVALTYGGRGLVDGLGPLVLEGELVGLTVQPAGKRLFHALASLVQRAPAGVTGLDAIDVHEPRISLAGSRS